MTPEERAAYFEDQAADEKAQHSPPVPIAQAIAKEYAVKLGKRVIADAERAGKGPGEIQAMRGRMLKWLEVIKAFEADRLEIRNDEKMTGQQKAVLLLSMRTELDRARVGIFGE